MKLKYYLRGLGFGILISTIVLTMASGRNTKVEKMTDEEVIERAKELGMEEKSNVTIDRDAINESIQKDTKNNTSKEDGEKENESSKAEDTEVPADKDQKDDQAKDENDKDDKKPDTPAKKDPADHKDDSKKKENKKPNVTRTITIKPGMTAKEVARLLQRSGVIADADDFNLYLLENKLTEKIRCKSIDIVVNSDYKTIADAITK